MNLTDFLNAKGKIQPSDFEKLLKKQGTYYVEIGTMPTIVHIIGDMIVVEIEASVISTAYIRDADGILQIPITTGILLSRLKDTGLLKWDIV